jgi:hypothetical protein
MKILTDLLTALAGNGSSVRVALSSASLLFLVLIFAGAVSSPPEFWTIDGEHWVLEQFVFDCMFGFGVCVLVQSVCWMDTKRPFDKTSVKKLLQLGYCSEEEPPNECADVLPLPEPGADKH